MKYICKVTDEFLRLLPDSHFVTVDCEFSGIGDRSKASTDIGSYLKALKDASSKFAMLQIGFCLAFYDDQDLKCPWSLYPYNLYTFPSKDENLCFNSTTVKWLLSNGFNFNRWINDGISYRRLAGEELSEPSDSTSVSETLGVHLIIDAIIRHRKPIVVHNGLLDILQIYDKFIGSFPDDANAIIEELYRLFGMGVFDTKNIANYLHNDCNYSSLSNRSLGMLYSALNSKFNFNKTTRLCETACNLKYIKKGKPPKLDTKRYHEAGFDATVTAMVFTAELSILAEMEGNEIVHILDAINGHHDKCGQHVAKLINCVNIHDPLTVSYLDLTGRYLRSKP